MSIIIADVETDGPIISVHSIVCFGAVIVRDGLKDTFYGKMKPLTSQYNPEALAISGFTRQEHEQFEEPKEVMLRFKEWIKEHSIGFPILMSDNNGYDASWLNYYFHVFTGVNPFGWSSRRIGDIYCGLVKDSRATWKHLRKTKHDHNPINDAKRNAEVLLHMRDNMGLKIKLN